MPQEEPLPPLPAKPTNPETPKVAYAYTHKPPKAPLKRGWPKWPLYPKATPNSSLRNGPMPHLSRRAPFLYESGLVTTPKPREDAPLVLKGHRHTGGDDPGPCAPAGGDLCSPLPRQALHKGPLSR